jgi:hypothetical protein
MTKAKNNQPLENEEANLLENQEQTPAKEAKTPKAETPAKEAKTPKAAAAELPLDYSKKRYALKVASVQIPLHNAKTERVEFQDVTPNRFGEKEQEALFAYWAERALVDPERFNIEAKISKLLVEVK